MKYGEIKPLKPEIRLNNIHRFGSILTAPQLMRLVAGFPPRWPEFDPRSSHMGFVVNKVELGRIFSEYFGFLSQISFHRMLHMHYSTDHERLYGLDTDGIVI
jgi:hypothetical protein